MTSSRQRRLALSALLFVLCMPAAARAQRSAQDIESARQLYNQGIELREKGDMKSALEKFRAAHALGNTPLTGIELCRAHAALKQPVEAREVCLGVARIPPFAQETQRSQDARAEAGRIAESEKPKIGALRIKITGVPAGWEPTVLVDAAAVPAAALGEARAVNPGTHSISARVGSGVETKGAVEVHEGETREIEMVVQPPPASERPVASAGPGAGPVSPPEKKNTFATVSLTIAGISAVIGTIGGIAAISGESSLSDKCTNKQCGKELFDDLDSAKTWGNVSTTFFVISGVALTAGLIAMLTSSPSRAASLPAKPRITPAFGVGGAGVYGSF